MFKFFLLRIPRYFGNVWQTKEKLANSHHNSNLNSDEVKNKKLSITKKLHNVAYFNALNLFKNQKHRGSLRTRINNVSQPYCH